MGRAALGASAADTIAHEAKCPQAAAGSIPTVPGDHLGVDSDVPLGALREGGRA